MSRRFLAALALVAGCDGDQAWVASAVGPLDDGTQDLDLGTILDDDLVAEAAPEGLPLPLPREADAGAPRVFFLWYADGGPPPSRSICTGTPPPFSCRYGTDVMDCKRKVQAVLDRMYADFNIIFTFERPTSGSFYTEIVTSSPGWCGKSSGVGGIAPFNCNDFNGNTCYAFECDNSARGCAVIIAQEQAHLVGLAHTNSAADIMYPRVCSSCTAFEDTESSVVNGQCRATQNSYRMMLARLGAWPAGTFKPDAFAPPCTDGAPPTITITEPADCATVAAGFTVKATPSDDCYVSSARIEMAPLGDTEETPGAGPYEWDVAPITEDQTITVTVKDGAGQTASASVRVRVPRPGNGIVTGGCAFATPGGGTERGLDVLALFAALALARRPCRRS